MRRMSSRCVWTLTLLIALVACGGNSSPVADGDDDQVNEQDDLPPVGDPSLAGPYLVGAMAETVTYEDPDTPGRIRTLGCTLWYPATVTGEPYYYDTWYRRDNVYDSVPFAAQAGPAPIMMFSHGNSGLAEQSWTLMEFLTSHGFMLLSCNHVGNTAADFQDDGDDKVPQSIHDRPRDIRAMIDRAEAINVEEGHLLKGAMDLNRIAMGGHSLGGFTTLMVAGGDLHFAQYRQQCEEDHDKPFCGYIYGKDCSMLEDGQASDPRVKVAVALAPAGNLFFEGEAGLSPITMPLMVMGGERDGTCPMDREVIPIYQYVSSPHKYLVTLLNTGHMSFSNICDLLGPVDEYLIEEGCGEGFSTPEEVFAVLNRYTYAFLMTYLMGDERYGQFLTPADPTSKGLICTLQTP